MRIGFVGTGVISAAVIEGLCRVGDGETAPEIVVSPRSEAISKDLAARHPNVRRAATNQNVVDPADVVCLGVLPSQLPEVAGTLRFRDHQIVISFVFGADPEGIAAGIDADVRVCQAVPLPTAARREGPLLLYPSIPEARDVLAPLGTLIEPKDPAQMAAYALGGAQMSSFFAMAQEAIEGLAAHGAPHAGARDYMMSMFGALAGTGLATDVDELRLLPERHETPGGVNEACRQQLERVGWIAGYRSGIEAVALKARDMAG
jgi:pyrroline-5-carboxylate reductase